ncbi:hypothetical protein RRF57_006004 [Xylaria bambusicola]|uniref:Uncharacterized protein n=1 Tax=Xylaria bambusicola TaxID=326684 RepID=A0AAN7UYS8_9PEZI
MRSDSILSTQPASSGLCSQHPHHATRENQPSINQIDEFAITSSLLRHCEATFESKQAGRQADRVLVACLLGPSSARAAPSNKPIRARAFVFLCVGKLGVPALCAPSPVFHAPLLGSLDEAAK